MSPNPNLELWDHGAVFSVLEASDGSFLVGGNFMQFMGVPRSNIVRVKADGELDLDFNPVIDGWVFDILRQPDDSIIIAGDFTAVNGVQRLRLARLYPDGSLDGDWAPAANIQVRSIAFSDDNNLLLGGAFTEINGVGRSRMAKVSLADGAVDEAWAPSANGTVLDLDLDEAGRLWIGGAFTEVNGESAGGLARLDESGGLDLSYDASASVHQIQVDGNEYVYVCGHFTEIDGMTRRRIARLNGNGNIDPDWVPHANLEVNACNLYEDELLLAGQFTAVNDFPVSGFARISPSTGEVDADFTPNATGAHLGNSDSESANWAIKRLDSERILVGGGFRYISGGPSASAALVDAQSGDLISALDAEFKAQVRKALVRLNDGSWLIGGSFRRSGSYLRDNVLRLHPDGSLDQQWYMAVSGPVLTAVLGPEESIYIGGIFNRVNESERNGAARLDTDPTWSLNSEWSPRLDGTVLVYQRDLARPNKLYVGGLFSLSHSNSAYSTNNFARISTEGDGQPDVRLVDPLINGQVNAIGQASDGRVYIGGTFTSAGGAQRRGLAAFKNIPEFPFEGSFDAQLNNAVWGLMPDESGDSMYVAGQFTSVKGLPRQRLAKLGPGFSDWNPQISSGTPIALALDGLGGLYVGGSFRRANDIDVNRLVRIDTLSGDISPTFRPAINDTFVWSLTFAENRLVVSGDFNQIDGVERKALAGFDVQTLVPDALFEDRFEFFESGRVASPAKEHTEENACTEEPADYLLITSHSIQGLLLGPTC